MDTRKFAAEIATVVVRHGIDLAGLQDAIVPIDTDKRVLWTTEPVIVHKSNGEVCAIRPEQAEDIMRSVGVLQDIAVYNGEGIKRMERPSGECIWP